MYSTIIYQSTSHISNESLEYLSKNYMEYVLIPPGMASYLQLCDISINKVFKDKVRFLFKQNGLLYDNIIQQLN